MKLLKSVKAPTARKRLISFALAVTTLLTALVVVPSTLPVTEVGAEYTTQQISDLWGKTGPHATQNNGMRSNHVFYASQWEGTLEYHNYFFQDYNATDQDKEGGKYFHYYKDTKSFIVRYKDTNNNLDPYVHFKINKTGYEMVSIDTSKYKYITITYSVHFSDPKPRTDQELSMTIYPLTSTHPHAQHPNFLTTKISLGERTVQDHQRIYHTAIFDLSKESYWTGSIHGFRLDYFNGYQYTASDGKKYSSDATYYPGTEKKPDIYNGMVMFIDSVGFFETKEAANHHADERDIARNYYVNNETNESYMNRNIYRAASQAWEGYIPTNNVRLLQNNTEFHYDESERAYKMSVTGTPRYDPYFSFLIDGVQNLNSHQHGDRAADPYQDIKNAVDRSLSNEYKYVAIVYKVNDAAKWRAVKDCHMTISLLYNVGNSNNDTDYDRAANKNGSAESRSLNEIDFDTSRYHTIVFYVGDFLENIAQKGKEARVNGFRLDYINGREYFLLGMEEYEEGSAIYIDSIGFFKTEQEANAFGRAPIHIDGTSMDMGEEHNMTTSYTSDGIQLTVANKCGQNEIKDFVPNSHCGHMKYWGNKNSAGVEVAIDPRANVMFEDGASLPTADYQYIVVTYTLPKKDINDLEKMHAPYTCGCQKNCGNEMPYNLYTHDEDGNPLPTKRSPLSIFLLYKATPPGGEEAVYANEDYRINEMLSENAYDVTIRCVLYVKDADKELSNFVGLRIDPFNYHYAAIGSHIIINSVDLYSTEAEAKGGEVDEYKDSYKVTITVDDKLPEGTMFGTAYKTQAKAILSKYSEVEALTDGKLCSEVTLSADNNYVRAHCEFAGWAAFYKQGDPNKPNCGEWVPLNKSDGTNTYKVGEQVLAELSADCYTVNRITMGGFIHMSLEVVLRPIWITGKQLLTIKPPSGAAFGGSIYKITGTNVFGEDVELYATAAHASSQDGTVSVWLPDGNDYKIQYLTDWGWRYLSDSDISKTVSVLQYSEDENKKNNETDQYVGFGIFKDSSDNYYQVPNADLDSCDFSEVTASENRWINYYAVSQNPTS